MVGITLLAEWIFPRNKRRRTSPEKNFVAKDTIFSAGKKLEFSAIYMGIRIK
jgi:hypothetical protein